MAIQAKSQCPLNQAVSQKRNNAKGSGRETGEASEMPCISSSVSSFISRGHCSARQEEDQVKRRRLEI